MPARLGRSHSRLQQPPVLRLDYGHLLDQASDALRAAGNAAGDTSANGHASLAATVAARTRAYEQLVRLVDQIGGPVSGSVLVPIAEQLVNSIRRVGATSASRLLGVSLRAAYVDLPTFTPAGAASDVTVAPHLAAAADLLAGHLGHPGGRPRYTGGAGDRRGCRTSRRRG